MTRSRQWTVLGTLAAMYLAGLALLVGAMNDSLRPGGSGKEISRRAEATVAAAGPEASHRPVSAGREAMEAALARGDISSAERVWREAYEEASRIRNWRNFADLGDAALRIGSVTGHRQPYVTWAREMYMAGFTRARAGSSFEGVVRIAEAFDALGDRATARQCLFAAEDLVGSAPDANASRRLRVLNERVAGVIAAPLIEP